MENLKTQIKKIKNHQEILTKVFKNLLESVAVIEEKLKSKDVHEINENENKVKQYDIENEIAENKAAIRKLDDKIEALTASEEIVHVNKCYHYDKGFCRSNKDCKFYHPEKTCRIYLKEGICTKVHCKDRHPKVCRHWKTNSCSRNGYCAYMHRNASADVIEIEIENMSQNPIKRYNCDLCNKITELRYYCEYCMKDFCSECTKQPSIEDLNVQFVGCKNIH